MTIKGGTLTTSSGGVIQAANFSNVLDGTATGGLTITAGSMVQVNNGALLDLVGTITNGGTIELDATDSNTRLTVDNEVTLKGGGRVVLSDNVANEVFSFVAGSTLDNVDNTISGVGSIGNSNLSLTNEAAGTIEADGSAPLVIDGNITNNGLLEATGNGVMQINGILTNVGIIRGVITQSGSQTTVTADAAGQTRLTGGSGDNHFAVAAPPTLIDGGGGNDTFELTASMTLAAGSLVNVETVQVDDGVTASLSALTVGEKIVLASAAGGGASVTGTQGADVVTGGAGNDILNGGAGADSMTGGLGNDTYYVDTAGDHVVEAVGGGTDIVRASVSYALQVNQEVEYLTTTNNAGTGAINLTGNNLANTIYGNAGANVLDGGAGSDTLAGLAGNDIYYVDNAADHVFEAAGGGADLVWTSVSYTLQAGQEVEKLYALSPNGTAAVNLTGNAFANTLAGTAGANVLNGGGGTDVMIGGAGNDTYYVDNPADQVIEAAGGGADVVRTSVSFTLTAGQEIETLITTNNAGTGAIDLIGNASNNTIYGNAGANVLNGGLGADTLVGSAGHDSFAFNTTLGPSNIDHVYDFAPSTTTDHDTIQLTHAVFTALPTGALAAAAFVDLASATETASSRILYDHTTGALSYDADGAGGAAPVQFAIIDNHAALTHGDFFIL